jgi:hypothetical protein
MPWTYSIEPVPDYVEETGKYMPHGMRVVKTFYSDSGEPVVSVDTTIQEAISESQTSISEEYYNEALASLKNQLDIMFELASQDQLPYVSVGNLFGSKLASVLADLVLFARENNNGQ